MALNNRISDAKPVQKAQSICDGFLGPVLVHDLTGLTVVDIGPCHRRPNPATSPDLEALDKTYSWERDSSVGLPPDLWAVNARKQYSNPKDKKVKQPAD